MSSLKVRVSFTLSLFDTRGLIKLGRFYGDYLAISLWWSSWAAKIAVYVRMYLVTDMDTDAKRTMRSRTLGVTFIFLYFSGFFCFTLVLKCGDLYILGLGGRNVKACCAIIHLVYLALLNIS